MPLDREELVHFYRQMVTIRRFEERTSEEFQKRAIPGVVHSYIGQEAVAVEVVDPRTLVPLDREAIRASVAKTGRLVVVDEACATCGAAAEIIALVTEDAGTFRHLKASPRRVCAPDVPIPYSPPMEKYVIPDKARIVGAVRGALGR